MADPANFDLKSLLDALIYAESNNDPMAVSKDGAVGLTQMMPSTAVNPRNDVKSIFDRADAQGFGYSDKSPSSASGLLADPNLSYMMGDDYLRAMLDLNNGEIDRALAAYNWGPTNAMNWSGKFSDLPAESKDYIPKIRSKYEDLTGSKLPEYGTYGTQLVVSPVPKPKPIGLLSR
jgi:soluble lytic murein transglycosylase-like protein